MEEGREEGRLWGWDEDGEEHPGLSYTGVEVDHGGRSIRVCPLISRIDEGRNGREWRSHDEGSSMLVISRRFVEEFTRLRSFLMVVHGVGLTFPASSKGEAMSRRIN